MALTLPGTAAASPSSRHPLIRPLWPITAGFCAGALPSLRSFKSPTLTCLYCVKGRGWCEVEGRKIPVRSGDVVLAKPGKLPRLSCSGREPCHVHWVQATGELLPDYLQELRLDPGQVSVRHAGLDPQLTRRFNEISRHLAQGGGTPGLLGAAHSLGTLLAALMQQGRRASTHAADPAEKVAEAITWMSEHLDEPLRVSGLARSAGLSPDYFSVLFRQQTGSSPRQYRHLLRMHRARQLLKDSALSIKEIARQLGYGDPFHFSRQFKQFEGVSPLRFRQRC